MSPHVVLIFSADPLAGALLAAAVELSGFVPHFARASEPARAALLRARPALVLIDCDHLETCTDEFIGPALMTGARALLFRSRRTKRNTDALEERLAVRVVDMPTDHESLTKILRETMEPESGESDRSSAGPL